MKKHLQPLMAVLIASAFICLLSTGCTSTKKYTKFVEAGLKKTDTSRVANPTCPGVTINTNELSKFDSLARVARGQNYFIPAIFYWGIKESFEVKLNPQLPVKVFSNVFYNQAKKNDLEAKLKGQRLELTIHSIPYRFNYVCSEDIIIPVCFYFILGKQAVEPWGDDLIVSFKVIKGDVVVKQGRIETANADRPVSNIMYSMKRITRQYLYQYQANVNSLSARCAAQLLAEINK